MIWCVFFHLRREDEANDRLWFVLRVHLAELDTGFDSELGIRVTTNRLSVEDHIDPKAITGQVGINVTPTLHLGSPLNPVVEVGLNLSQVVPALGLNLVLQVGVATPLFPFGIGAKGCHPFVVPERPAYNRLDVQISTLEAEAEIQIVRLVLLLQHVVADALETRLHTRRLVVVQVEPDLSSRRMSGFVPDVDVAVMIPARDMSSFGLANQDTNKHEDHDQDDQSQEGPTEILGSVLVKQHDSFLSVRPISWPGLQTSVLEPI